MLLSPVAFAVYLWPSCMSCKIHTDINTSINKHICQSYRSMNKEKWKNNKKKYPDAYVFKFIEMLYAKRYMHIRNMYLYKVY